MDEANLLEKLRCIEALFAGATTEGEKLAAAEARRRVQGRLELLEEEDPPVEYRFRLDDPWSRKLFTALCRRYEVRTYRYHGQKRSSIMANVSRRFVDETLWPEYEQLSRVLRTVQPPIRQGADPGEHVPRSLLPAPPRGGRHRHRQGHAPAPEGRHPGRSPRRNRNADRPPRSTPQHADRARQLRRAERGAGRLPRLHRRRRDATARAPRGGARALVPPPARGHRSVRGAHARSVSILPVARACQARCPFCFSKASVSDDVATRPLDWARIAEVLHSARLRGAERAVVTGGGEPTLIGAEALERLITAARMELPKVVLISNGAQLGRATPHARKEALRRLDLTSRMASQLTPSTAREEPKRDFPIPSPICRWATAPIPPRYRASSRCDGTSCSGG